MVFENAEHVSVDKWRHPVLVMRSVLAAAHRNLQYVTKHTPRFGKWTLRNIKWNVERRRESTRKEKAPVSEIIQPSQCKRSFNIPNYTTFTMCKIFLHSKFGCCNCIHVISSSWPGSSVGIVTDYGLDRPGSNPGGMRFSARPDRPWGPPSLLYNGYRVFPGGRGGRSVGLRPTLI